MSEPNILRLTGEKRLPNAHVLSEYDAIIVDPRFAPLLGYADLAPGSVTNTDHAATVLGASAELEKRSKELESFFGLGGIAVVHAYAEAVLVSRQARMYTDAVETVASTHRWFYDRLVPPPRYLRPGERPPFPSDEPPEPWIRPGQGEHIRVVEPGHAFAPYLASVRAYAARFGGFVRDWSNATILAENRAGEPVAVEFAAGRGAVLVVPPPADSPGRGILFEALRQLLRERVSVGREWRLASEEQLGKEEQELALRHREERRDLAERRAESQAVKTRVFEAPIVKRIAAYWDRATAAGATHEQSLQQLYKLIEVLEDSYGGERELPSALGVDRAKLKAVKRLANQSEYDIRHAGAGETEALPLPSFNEALEFGRQLMQAFLERRARETAVRDVAGDPKNPSVPSRRRQP